VGLSSKLFLISADNTLHALANAAFMRMLRREAVSRIPDFAGQRVRQASVVTEVVGGTPTRLVRCTFAILEINGEGLLDVERWNLQQFPRVSDPFEPDRPVHGTESLGIDAVDRFIARGGSWEPDHPLMRRIEATALRRLACQQVRVVR